MKKFLDSRDWLIEQYKTQSMQAIAKSLGVGTSTVQLRFKKFAIPTRPSWDTISKIKKTESQKTKMSAARKAYWDAHTNRDEFKMKISKTKTKHGITQGRRRIYKVGRGAILDYRLVMEEVMGRPLTTQEVVHHKDGNPLNCSPENLQITTQSEHARLHTQKRKRDALGRFK